MSASHIRWYLPTEIFFGAEALLQLRNRAPGLGGKAFLVTGQSFASGSGLLDEILFLLGEAETPVTHFPGARENPDPACVREGAAFCRREGCDFLVAAGGGSAIDAAKGIALAAANPGNLERYFSGEPPAVPPLPVVAIPTTAGSGSEVTRYAVFTVAGEKTKKTVACDSLIPRLALVQPSLCLSLSPRLTAVTGLDALCHAIEGALSARATPLAVALAEKTVRLAREFLPRAVSKPGDGAAREGMSLAALLAGMIINQSGTIIGHGMGYPMTVVHGIPHGLAGALILPEILGFLARRGRAGEITALTGWPDPAREMRLFLEQLGVPASLSAAGIRKGDLEGLAADAFSGSRRSLDRLETPVTEEDFLSIYRAAF